MTDIEGLKERLSAMARFRTAVRPVPLGVKSRDERDGQDRFDVIGHPCGIPIATFGDMNDAALFHFIAANADDLIAGITSLQSKLAEAERALEQAALWFEEYAEHHAKLAEVAGHHVGQERDAKARRNQERADYLRAPPSGRKNPSQSKENEDA